MSATANATMIRSADVVSSTGQGGISATAYRGDGMVLLAFDVPKEQTAGLAGFAIERTDPDGTTAYLPNRLSFSQQLTAKTKPEQRQWTASNAAPFQKFRWVDVPPKVSSGAYKYRVSAMYFAPSGSLKQGPQTEVEVEIVPHAYGAFEMGFTRGYLSSQAYVDLFKNAPIRPAKKSIDFPTAPYAKQYDWLGGHARRMVFSFVKECLDDPSISVDVFAYDVDEPDFVKSLTKLGKRLRIFMDNATLHTKTGAMEPKVLAQVKKSAGAANVKVGHFARFAHNKVIIQKRGGRAVKVLTGSANFSIRGLYVQANNVLVFDDPGVAAKYEQAFEQAFTDATKFKSSAIAKQWFDISGSNLPPGGVCFSPHKDAAVSLSRVAEAVTKAKSSVFFAVMEMGGSGELLDDLKKLGSQNKVFSYGMTQSSAALKLYKPGQGRASLASFDYLKAKVPEPFRAEWNGGTGMVIHHKFVVVDFNGAAPVVFTGSSNLAAGGETQNGDNLIQITDASVATAYGVEAIRLFDHYHFRDAMKTATATHPLTLQLSDAQNRWWEPYFDSSTIKYWDRLLFAGQSADRPT